MSGKSCSCRHLSVSRRNGEEEILNVARLKDSAHLSNCEGFSFASSKSLVSALFANCSFCTECPAGPLVHGKVWDKERDRLNSSPHSSIDLEWENEVGKSPKEGLFVPDYTREPDLRRRSHFEQLANITFSTSRST